MWFPNKHRFHLYSSTRSQSLHLRTGDLNPLQLVMRDFGKPAQNKEKSQVSNNWTATCV